MNSTSSKNNLPKFGIALSGGGARGIAHIGVLDALENFGIKPQVVSGASMGAIVGVFYAAGYSPKIMMERKFHKMINWHRPFSRLIDMGQVQKVMAEMIGEDDFTSLKMPGFNWRSCKPQRARRRSKWFENHCRTRFQAGHCPKCGGQQKNMRFCD